jgi:Spy/CpxP family protein refolding chaperone
LATLLATMAVVLVAFFAPAMADNGNRHDNERFNHRHDDDGWWNRGDHEDCCEWSWVFEERQSDCD